MNKEEILKIINEHNEYIKDYSYIMSIFSFDHYTIAPKNSSVAYSKAASRLDNDLFKKQKDPLYINAIIEGYKIKDEFNDIQKRYFELAYRKYEKIKNITVEDQYEESLILNEGYDKWVEAREKCDYKVFEPALSKLVDSKLKNISKRDFKLKTNYDNLLDDYEPGNNEEILDKFFNELKEGVIPLLKKIQAKAKPNTSFINAVVKEDKQEKIAYELLKHNKFDLDSGVMSLTIHPFTMYPSEKDVRITTKYIEDIYLSSIYSVIHEGGHAIFGQCEPHEFHLAGLNDKMTSAQNETISRFYENIICRSKEYIKYLYDLTMDICKDEFKGVEFEDFYKAVNLVEPSLIRTEADELTYCLHIIIRYEIEKGLINKTLSTKDLNLYWNKLYKEYLGVDVKNDNEGILQDVHWSDGSMGYFPSYALGNAYGAMIFNKMNEDFDVLKAVSEGKMELIKDWLTKHVFSIAGLNDPNEWIYKITGRKFTTKDYIDYLTIKYSKIYDL